MTENKFLSNDNIRKIIILVVLLSIVTIVIYFINQKKYNNKQITNRELDKYLEAIKHKPAEMTSTNPDEIFNERLEDSNNNDLAEDLIGTNNNSWKY